MTKGPVTTENSAVGNQKDTSSLSSLSRQLSESAVRAAARDSSLSRKELGEKASELLSKISGDGYFANKKANDAEVPDTQDPALLARADNATQFVNGTGKNPFAGMSSDQRSLIIYEDTGGLRLMNAARRGKSRRITSIVNPVSFYALAIDICEKRSVKGEA
ncbi:hypothetical protein [Pseudomonas sp. NFACC07-1]|uniref:hypothetical protein n=1 Tax=Pseudomonas sp. NFACC07-1 TaxID=1566239 RepID=UPI001587463A|nr:hypothetical protein [Pseudomonas sp. NFACC07-1]